MKIATAIRIAAVIFLLGAAASRAAAGRLPESNPETLREFPLDPGAVAVVPDAASGTAAIYVGGENGELLRVGDPCTIRGSRLEAAAESELAISVSEGFSVSNGVYTLTAPTGAISIACETAPIEKVECKLDWPFFVGPDCPSSRTAISGNTATITVTRAQAAKVEVFDLRVLRYAFGDTPSTNDLLHVSYCFRDELGLWTLDRLRPWTKHLYDGNRGIDWSRYAATNSVNINSQRLLFDANARYAAAVENTNLVFSAGGNPYFEVSFRGINVAPEGHLRFTGIKLDSASHTCTLTVGFDIDSFDPSRLTLLTRTSLAEGDWAPLALPLSPTNTYTVTYSGATAGFYKLSYDADPASSTLSARFLRPVEFEEGIIIKGSGASSNTYYRIRVENGVISATAIAP